LPLRLPELLYTVRGPQQGSTAMQKARSTIFGEVADTLTETAIWAGMLYTALFFGLSFII